MIILTVIFWIIVGASLTIVFQIADETIKEISNAKKQKMLFEKEQQEATQIKISELLIEQKILQEQIVSMNKQKDKIHEICLRLDDIYNRLAKNESLVKKIKEDNEKRKK